MVIVMVIFSGPRQPTSRVISLCKACTVRKIDLYIYNNNKYIMYIQQKNGTDRCNSPTESLVEYYKQNLVGFASLPKEADEERS